MAGLTDPLDFAEAARRVAALDELAHGMASRAVPPPAVEAIPFVPTSAFETIRNIAELCIARSRNGMVLGEPGVGKTVAIRELERRSEEGTGPHVRAVKIEPAYQNSPSMVFREFVPLLGARMVHGRVDETIQALPRLIQQRPLVIFDEAQNLGLRTLFQLLSISEDNAVPMLFVGNPDVVKLVRSREADLRQIGRRLSFRDEIRGTTDADADLVAKAYRVEGVDAVRLCRQIGRAHHVDGVAFILREVRFDQGGDAPIGAGAILAALDGFPHMRDRIEGVAKVVPLNPPRSPKPRKPR